MQQLQRQELRLQEQQEPQQQEPEQQALQQAFHRKRSKPVTTEQQQEQCVSFSFFPSELH
ncbi:MAG: hypothetical protein A2Z95_06765 [Gallionellales bacterium GWA2_60_18]|nr:MAG: hypothetical protein A2Z95_06765 [Gallionellales bacterium GWA2_60_18]